MSKKKLATFRINGTIWNEFIAKAKRNNTTATELLVNYVYQYTHGEKLDSNIDDNLDDKLDKLEDQVEKYLENSLTQCLDNYLDNNIANYLEIYLDNKLKKFSEDNRLLKAKISTICSQINAIELNQLSVVELKEKCDNEKLSYAAKAKKSELVQLLLERSD